VDQQPLNGVLVVDKPSGMSSAAVVAKVRRALALDRAGHGGTLDPLATGVLAICLGPATKIAQYLLADDKAYEADARLGVETDTLDRTGAVTAEHAVAVTREAVVAALAARTGEQEQVPPMYSAIKQGGVPLYARARAGETVERAPRRIRIDRLELLAFDPPLLRVAIACSKGTYVRSLLADVGRDLGCGAHLTELRRTRSGRFTLADAVSLDRVGELAAARLIAPTAALDLPVVRIAEELVPKIVAGQQLPVEVLGTSEPHFQIVDPAGELRAVAHAEAGRVVYERVWA
jgi:tRNA pseudouridine55 synthase